MAKLDEKTRSHLERLLRRYQKRGEPVSPAAIRRQLRANGLDASESAISRMAGDMGLARRNGPEAGTGGRPTGSGKKFSRLRPKILAAIGKGKTNKDIALALGCSAALVSIYRRELKKNT